MKGILTVFLLAALFASSCSNRVTVQRDESANLSNYKTYMWVVTRSSETDSSRRLAFADMSVKNTVKDELTKHGWQEVGNDPDVLISYDILVERNVETRNEPVYSQPFSRVYYNPYLRRYATIVYPSRFMGYQYYEEPVREGTITLTMMDARTDKPIWQAWTTQRMDQANITAEEVSRAVKNIFRKFDGR